MAEKSKFNTKLQKYLSQPGSEEVSITDVEDKYYNNEQLSADEVQALRNFEKYRMRKLTESKDNHMFNKNFSRLRVLSNLAPYTEFLKPKYSR
jgi:hypothetical protein